MKNHLIVGCLLLAAGSALAAKPKTLSLAKLNKTVDKMVSVARKVKDLNKDGEVQRFELSAATKRFDPKFAKAMEAIRYGSGYWARDLIPGGNPYFSYNQFIDDYRSLKSTFKRFDKDKNRQLDAKEMKKVKSKMHLALVSVVK